MTEPASLLLPEQTRLVHIGPPKTGSTALQVAMDANRTEMAQHGVHYAGEGLRPKNAGWVVLGIGPSVGQAQPSPAAWDDLVQEVEQAGNQRVCISNEDFAKATDDKAVRIVDELGGDRVRVVAIARRLDRLLPSWWQERVKARLTLTFDAWLELVLGPESPAYEWRNFWISQDIEKLVDRWTRRNGPDSFTVVVSDDTDQTLIPRTFEQMLGLPEGLIDTSNGPTNRSLSMLEAELVRRVNKMFIANKWDNDHYLNMVQSGIVPSLRAQGRVAGDRALPPLPPWAVERVAEISDRMIGQISASGVRVVGELEALRTPVPVESADLTEASSDIGLELAVRAVDGVVRGSLRLARNKELSRSRAAKERKRTARELAQTPGGRRVRDATSADLLQVVARRVSRRVRNIARR